MHPGIQQNILDFIKEAVEKLKITFLIPQILANPQALKNCVEGTKYAGSSLIVQMYFVEKHKAEKAHQNDVDTEQQLKLRLDVIERKLIEYFHKNLSILDILPSWSKDFSKRENLMIKALQLLYQIAEGHLRKNVVTHCKHEKLLRSLYFDSELKGKAAEELKLRLQNHRSNRRQKTEQIDTLARNCAAAIERMNKFKELEYNRELAIANKRVRLIDARSCELKDLKEELERRNKEKREIERVNRKEMKTARDKRQMLIIQIQDINKKRDRLLLEKFKEKLQLQEELKRQKQKMITFLLQARKIRREHDLVVGHYGRDGDAFQNAVRVHLNSIATKIQRWMRQRRPDIFDKKAKLSKARTSRKSNMTLPPNLKTKLDTMEFADDEDEEDDRRPSLRSNKVPTPDNSVRHIIFTDYSDDEIQKSRSTAFQRSILRRPNIGRNELALASTSSLQLSIKPKDSFLLPFKVQPKSSFIEGKSDARRSLMLRNKS